MVFDAGWRGGLLCFWLACACCVYCLVAVEGLVSFMVVCWLFGVFNSVVVAKVFARL